MVSRIHNPRDVSTGATGATAVAPKFLDTLTLSPPGGQILPTIAEVATKYSPWLHLNWGAPFFRIMSMYTVQWKIKDSLHY